MIGVDYDLFWTLNPKSLSPFIKAFKLKQEYDDNIAWVQGAYIRMAIASVFGKETKYPKKPLSNSKSVEDHMSAEQIKQKMFERMRIINNMHGKEESDGL